MLSSFLWDRGDSTVSSYRRISVSLLTLADIWQNRKRAQIIAEMGISAEESKRLGQLNAEADMTDRENIHFKYQY